uniref:F-box/LRR-repeat protein 4 n=2 Tax=Schistocephalus solidus TaxID=70667 RepID=A0A0X3PGI4_SCHSO
MNNEPKFFEYVELFAQEVVDCSSQYGTDGRTAYVAENIAGPPNTYPIHSDSTSSFAFRNYGTRWPSIFSSVSSMSGDPEGYPSTDYVDCFFDRALIVTSIQIFETYFPGAVVAIRACYRDQPSDKPVNARGLYWVTLWQASSENLPNAVTGDNRILLASTPQPMLEIEARIFEPPFSHIPLVPTDLIRVEFDTRRTAYFTQVDAIRAKGYAPLSPDAAQRLREMNTEATQSKSRTNRYRVLLADEAEDSFSSPSGGDFTHLSISPARCLPPTMSVNLDDVDDTPDWPPAILPGPEQADNALIAARSSLLCPLSMTLYDPPQLSSITFLTQSTLVTYRSSHFYRNSPLMCLPDDVLLRIFSFLDLRHLCRVSSVCRLFQHLANYTIAHLTAINLQPFWPSLNDNHLLHLAKRLSCKPTIFTQSSALGTAASPGCRIYMREMLREHTDAASAPSVRYHSWNARHQGVAEEASVLSGLLSPSSSSVSKRVRGLSATFTQSVATMTEAELTGVSNSAEAKLKTEAWADGQEAQLDVTEQNPEEASTQRLRRLDMSWCGNYRCISPPFFCHFLSEACQHLTSLRLAACRMVTDDSLLHIINTCGLLQELDLSSCRSVTSAGFVPLGRLINLRWLSLYRTQVDEQALSNLANLCQYLRHLNLGSCGSITNVDSVIVQIAANNPLLASLDLWRSRSLTAEGLMRLADSSPSLQHLDLGWCSGVESQPSNCFAYLVSRCPNIRTMNLTSIRSICEADLQAFGEGLDASLESLELVGNGLITQAAVETLLSQCKNLRFLDLSNCPGISLRAFLCLCANHPTCQIVSNYHAFMSAARGTFSATATATMTNTTELLPARTLQPLPAPPSVTEPDELS